MGEGGGVSRGVFPNIQEPQHSRFDFNRRQQEFHRQQFASRVTLSFAALRVAGAFCT